MIIRPKIREGRGKVKIWFWVPKKKDMVLVLIKSKFSQYLIKSTQKKKKTLKVHLVYHHGRYKCNMIQYITKNRKSCNGISISHIYV